VPSTFNEFLPSEKSRAVVTRVPPVSYYLLHEFCVTDFALLHAGLFPTFAVEIGSKSGNTGSSYQNHIGLDAATPRENAKPRCLAGPESFNRRQFQRS